MLGLGNLVTKHVFDGGYVDPSSLGTLALWLKFNTGIFSDQAASSGTVYSPPRSSDADNLSHNDRISQWSDQSGNNNHAVQDASHDKPRWDTSGGGNDKGAVKMASNAKFMDLTSGITLTGDFTIQIRFRAGSFGSAFSFLGDSATDLFRATDATEFRAILGGAGVSAWDDGSATALSAGDNTKRQIVTFTRSSGALSVHVNGGTAAGGWNNEQDDVDWDAAENHSDTDTFTISNIGSAADDSENMFGWVFDVLIYDGVALTEAQRKQNYDYLNSQSV